MLVNDNVNEQKPSNESTNWMYFEQGFKQGNGMPDEKQISENIDLARKGRDTAFNDLLSITPGFKDWYEKQNNITAETDRVELIKEYSEEQRHNLQWFIDNNRDKGNFNIAFPRLCLAQNELYIGQVSLMAIKVSDTIINKYSQSGYVGEDATKIKASLLWMMDLARFIFVRKLVTDDSFGNVINSKNEIGKKVFEIISGKNVENENALKIGNNCGYLFELIPSHAKKLQDYIARELFQMCCNVNRMYPYFYTNDSEFARTEKYSLPALKHQNPITGNQIFTALEGLAGEDEKVKKFLNIMQELVTVGLLKHDDTNIYHEVGEEIVEVKKEVVVKTGSELSKAISNANEAFTALNLNYLFGQDPYIRDENVILVLAEMLCGKKTNDESRDLEFTNGLKKVIGEVPNESWRNLFLAELEVSNQLAALKNSCVIGEVSNDNKSTIDYAYIYTKDILGKKGTLEDLVSGLNYFHTTIRTLKGLEEIKVSKPLQYESSKKSNISCIMNIELVNVFCDIARYNIAQVLEEISKEFDANPEKHKTFRKNAMELKTQLLEGEKCKYDEFVLWKFYTNDSFPVGVSGIMSKNSTKLFDLEFAYFDMCRQLLEDKNFNDKKKIAQRDSAIKNLTELFNNARSNLIIVNKEHDQQLREFTEVAGICKKAMDDVKPFMTFDFGSKVEPKREMLLGVLRPVKSEDNTSTSTTTNTSVTKSTVTPTVLNVEQQKPVDPVVKPQSTTVVPQTQIGNGKTTISTSTSTTTAPTIPQKKPEIVVPKTNIEKFSITNTNNNTVNPLVKPKEEVTPPVKKEITPKVNSQTKSEVKSESTSNSNVGQTVLSFQDKMKVFGESVKKPNPKVTPIPKKQ